MPAWVVTVTLTVPTGATGDVPVIDVAEGDLRDVGEIGGDGNDDTARGGAAAGARLETVGAAEREKDNTIARPERAGATT